MAIITTQMLIRLNCLGKLVAVNQFISGELQNKVVTNENWFTVV